MNDDLLNYITAIIQRMVAHLGMDQAEATRQVKLLIKAARSTYRAQGSPLGATDTGFYQWLKSRPQPPVD